MSTYETLLAAATATADVCVAFAADAATVAEETRLAANKAREYYVKSIAELSSYGQAADYHFTRPTEYSANREQQWKEAASKAVDAIRTAVDAVAAATAAYDALVELSSGGDRL